MIFTLEALKAAYGDALLLHFGEAKAPRLAVIDGGPPGVYKSVLKPGSISCAPTRRGSIRTVGCPSGSSW
jgi:hypothetical protein